MPDITEYVRKLNELKLRSMDDYNRTMENYRTNYPDFYNQLMQAMEAQTATPTKAGQLKDFFFKYKWYLITIFGGVAVIVILLFLLAF
jgi:spore germination protein YaaH